MSCVDNDEIFDWLVCGEDYFTWIVELLVKVGQCSHYKCHRSLVFSPEVFEEVLKRFHVVFQYSLHYFQLQVLGKVLVEFAF